MKPLLFLFACAGFAGLAQTPPTFVPYKPNTSSVPILIHNADAEYMSEARPAGLQGTVYLHLEVSPEGKPEKVQVMHGLGLGLDEKATEAVKQWQFKPGTTDGHP